MRIETYILVKIVFVGVVFSTNNSMTNVVQVDATRMYDSLSDFKVDQSSFLASNLLCRKNSHILTIKNRVNKKKSIETSSTIIIASNKNQLIYTFSV